MMIMKFYIREWNEDTIVLMTEMGHILGYYSSTEEALKARDGWYKFKKEQSGEGGMALS